MDAEAQRGEALSDDVDEELPRSVTTEGAPFVADDNMDEDVIEAPEPEPEIIAMTVKPAPKVNWLTAMGAAKQATTELKASCSKRSKKDISTAAAGSGSNKRTAKERSPLKPPDGPNKQPKGMGGSNLMSPPSPRCPTTRTNTARALDLTTPVQPFCGPASLETKYLLLDSYSGGINIARSSRFKFTISSPLIQWSQRGDLTTTRS